MATFTLKASGYWGDNNILTSGTWGGMARGDTVNCNGFNLTVDASVTTPTSILTGINVTNNYGLGTYFKLVNSSTSAALLYNGYSNGLLAMSNGAIVETAGDKIVIYTGNGAEDQTTSGWTSAGFGVVDEPGAVEVETGSATNVWEYWPTLGAKALTDMGVDELGKFISYNNSTGVITFGNGGKPKALISSAADGQKVVNVSDGTVFSADDYVHLIEYSGATIVRRETCKIASIATNQLTMVANLVYSYTTAAKCRLTKGCNIIPDGARVRVNNIGIGTINSSGIKVYETILATNYELGLSTGGIFKFNNVNFFGFYINISSNGLGCYFTDCTYVGNILVGSNLPITFTKFIIGVDRYSTSVGIGIYCNSSDGSMFTFYNCKIVRNTTATITSLNTSNFTDCEFYLITRAYTYSAVCVPSLNTTFIRCKFVGGLTTLGNYNTLTDCSHSDSTNAIPKADGGSTPFSAVSRLGVVVDNMSSILDGDSGTSISGYFFDGGTLIKNCTLTPRTTAIWRPSPGIKSAIRKCTLKSTGTHLFGLACSQIDITIQDITTPGYLQQLSNVVSSLLKVRNCGETAAAHDITPGPAQDTHFRVSALSETTGFIGLFFCPKSSTGTGYTVSNVADIVFNNNGKMYIVGNSGWILWESEWIYGVTDYDGAGAIGKNGTNTGNFTYEYQIDVGAGWTDLASLTVANLTAHIIINGKHRLRIKMSRIGGNATGNLTDYIDRLTLPTIRDNTILYPESDFSITCQNVKDDSWVTIEQENGNVLISDTQQDGTDDMVTTLVPYNAPEYFRITIRKASAVPYYKEYQTRVLSDGTDKTVYISQVED